MTAALLGVCVSLLLAGLLVIGIGWRGSADPGVPVAAQPPGRLAGWRLRWQRLPRARRLQLAGGPLAGLLVTLVTGWVPALALIPLAAVVLPRLVVEPRDTDLLTLESLDRWVRLLSASIATGKSIPEAIRSTVRQSPALLQPHLALMVERLDDQWSTEEALIELAEDLGQADADEVAVALITADRRGGVGIRTILNALAENLQETVAARRELSIEQAKPRIVVRQVSIITLTVLVVAMVTSPAFFQPYGTAMGQLIAAGLAGCYLLSLLMLSRLTATRPRNRVLTLAVVGRG